MYLGFAGTYTKKESKGIYSFLLDTKEEKIKAVKVAAEISNPTYVAISKDNQNLYSVAKDEDLGGVAAFKINQEAGNLEELNRKLSEGPSPCHVSVNGDRSVVLSANYHRGTVDAYSTLTDGSLQKLIDTVQHKGHGLDPQRQEKPHVHFAGFTPDEKYIVAVDLGTDKLVTYRLENGNLTENSTLTLRPGSGPRHITFHPNGRFAYIMTELSSEVIQLQYHSNTGSFEELQYISTIPDDFTENNQGSAIHITKDGKFVYAANRGHNSIALFRVDETSGNLTFVEHTSTEGDWPRDFVLDPTERFLVASNQNTGNLVLFKRDQQSGKLTYIQGNTTVPEVVCVKFIHE
ncbi:lactonase family protein [Fervidibacillus halotolerans]|uniref:Lactonase family protein n=1 Tax=Fervidibacillus halotolerans TaxID=2980027 RepID=A0A9E8RYI6_9BACI|nr:lactonase family protein [Fervidibacillus halotolerans]WAA13860.1 lactonase family protein [Fervidibacillus halotolerans]